MRSKKRQKHAEYVQKQVVNSKLRMTGSNDTINVQKIV